MDSPEIKSASLTASEGANIPVHFFIDLHSSPTTPHHHARVLSPRLNPPPARRCLLLFPSCLRCPDLQWSPGLRLMMSCAIFIIPAFEISGEEKESRRRRKREGQKNTNTPWNDGGGGGRGGWSGGRKNMSTLCSPKFEFARQFALRCPRESH